MDVFGGAPRFLAYPRAVGVQTGTDAVLKCQISGDPRPAVIWERNNEKVHPGGRYRVFEDGNIYNLIITGVTTEDSGQYICKAKNCIGETYAAATLKVEGEAQEMELREENKPRFLIKPLSTRVGRGEDAVFSCKLWGNPRPEVVWEKDGRKLNEIFESTHFSVGYQDGGWYQLKIFKTRAPDGGVYTCKARNEFGESLAGAVLLVDAGPGHEDEGNRNAKVKMFAVTEGKHAKFRCFVTGKPKPEIIWRKDGRLIMSGRRYLLYEDREGYFTLKVLYCKQQDNGVYVCAASNTAGQTLSAVHLSVKEPPVRFKQPLNDLQVWERDLAVLECEVPEDSIPITWYLEDRRLQPGAKYGMEEWGTKRRLTIRDIGVDDDGIYLCEMADGGRSIAEVAVKGTIVRKLPRKVDVLEGENAAFCVEVEEEEMEIHWYKDGTELRETHQTILKSFGKTHILVFVNTTPQDSGLVTFYVGRSKTSSQLRVKGARHCPPSCPVGVQINTERANAALLSWIPAPDSRKNPPSGYVLERQEVGSQEWLQCLTTDSATSVEILGDSVPCEADYRFRICSVNKYGRSDNVEFPRSVHLVPVARIQTPLQDALVPEGQDALFSIELSASVIGTWFLNGNQLQEEDRFSMRRTRTHQSLRIRGVRDTDNGAEITFIAYGIRDSAALYIQGILSPLCIFMNHILASDDNKLNKFVEVGNPIVLYCELSNPEAPVHWYKNGVELHTSDMDFQSNGTQRTLVVQSAEFCHSGIYSCKTKGDAVHFKVDVKAPPVTFLHIPEEDLHKNVVEHDTLLLSCELSRADVLAQWYKDGVELQPNENTAIQMENTVHTVKIKSSQLSDSGIYTCRAGDSALMFKVNPPAMIVYPKEDVHLDRYVPEEIVLSCELSRPNGSVNWYKDGQKLQESENIKLKLEGPYRRLKILKSATEDSGEYVCDTAVDSRFFHLNVTEPPVRIMSPSQSQMELCQQTSERMVLSCELSRANAVVRWYRDGLEVEENDRLLLEVDGIYRRLIIPETDVKDSAEYVCDTMDESVTFFVNIAASVGETVVLDCEVSRANAEVCWRKNGEEIEESANITITEDGLFRSLIILNAEAPDAGEYVCDAKDDTIKFCVIVEEPPVTILGNAEKPEHHSLVAGDDLILECEVSRSNAPVAWYRNGQLLRANSRTHIESQGTVRKLVLSGLELSDSGEYVCNATEDKMLILVTVQEAPVKFNDKEEGSKAVAYEDESVTLCAKVNRENACVRWLKDKEEIIGNRYRKRSEGKSHYLTIEALKESDSGKYTCDAKNDEMHFLVLVKVALKDSDLLLLCELQKPKGDVQWLKDDKEVTPSRHYIIRANGCERSLTIHNVTAEDAGVYACESKDERTYATVELMVFTSSPAPRVVEFVAELHNVTVMEGEDATFKCVVSPEDAKLDWCINGKLVAPDQKFNISSTGLCHMLHIHNCQVTDSAKVTAEAEGLISKANLHVQEAQVVFIKGMETVEAEEFGEATLEVKLSSDSGEVQWMRQGMVIKPGPKFTLKQRGATRSLTIHRLALSDRGTYSCETAGETSTACSVDVYEPEVEVLQPLEDLEVQEDENAVFMCELSLESVPGEWFKNGERIKPTSTIKIRQEGSKHFLLMCNVKGEDGGEIKFVAKNTESIAYLEVEELPVSIVNPLQDKTALEKSRVLLDCSVSNPRCSIRWYKGSNVILPSERFEICSEGCYRKLVIQQVNLEDEGTYSVQVGDYTSSAKLTVEGMVICAEGVSSFSGTLQESTKKK
uniref:Obscurin-like protein 1 n=1 Tax=Denticeps clupeoides TaxID=299321 RepID=A0AAY4BK29_9TELE